MNNFMQLLNFALNVTNISLNIYNTNLKNLVT